MAQPFISYCLLKKEGLNLAKKIVFVDDEPDILHVTSFRLKKAGYEVIIGVNGQEAIDLAKSTSPDLMFIDLRLPILAGDEVCKRMKSDDSLKQIPVILFTASTYELEKIAQEAGADDFLTKPFTPEQLLEKVKRFIG